MGVPTPWLADGLRVALGWLGVAMHSAFGILHRPRVFTISVPNTTHLSRLPRRGLGAPWTNPGQTLDMPWYHRTLSKPRF
jgi:hypothetical protein